MERVKELLAILLQEYIEDGTNLNDTLFDLVRMGFSPQEIIEFSFIDQDHMFDFIDSLVNNGRY